jgi:ribonuclease P protein component
MPGARLLQRARICKPAEFEQAYAEGFRLRGGSIGGSGDAKGRAFLGLVCRPNGLQHPRLGLAIARKVLPRAVDRNRIKRLVRDDFRHNQDRLPAADLVIYGQPGLKQADAEQIRKTLAEFWLKVIDRCAGC